MAAPDSNDAGKAPPRVGSYRLIQPLGSGGMSSVFHAIHLETGHEVAVKVLPRTLARNPTLLQRFLREANNAESLEHPNIAAIYDRGFDQGRHYLVLEYVPGGDLHERVRAGGPLPIDEAIRVIRSVAEGLDYASGRGVIHRDVKPANLLVTPEGLVKIIDLGLALQTEDDDERVTRDGTTVGTVDYMAPEQARDSRATSERSDIYSLGCTFYFLLTGSPPYPGGDVPDKLGRHCTATIPDVRDLRPEVPEPLALLITRMMAKKPESRFTDYRQLIAALDALTTPGGVSNTGLDALIAEDDEDEVQDALIADDEEDEVLLAPFEGPPPKPERPRLPVTTPPKPRDDRRSQRSDVEPAPAEISLAMLAGIEDDAVPTRGRRRPVAPALAPGPDLLEVEPVRAVPRATSQDIPLSTWVAAGAVLGLAIALLGFGVLQFLGPSRSDAVPSAVLPDEGQGGAGQEVVPPIIARPQVRPTDRPAVITKPAALVATPSPPPWTEPAEPINSVPPEPSHPGDVEANSLPEWARRPIPTTVEGPEVTVRRVPGGANPAEVDSLRKALDRAGGVVEIADNGPFFEDDFRVAGKARMIRARAGYRPMIVVEPSSSALVRDRSSVFSLDGSKLILEGLDLVIDARSLPQPLTTLFHLKGSELTLNRCTVTVLNGAQHPFSLVRVEEPGDQRPNRSSQLRLENSLIRGPSPAVFDMLGPGDVAIMRTIVVGGNDAVVVQRANASRGDRRYFFYRSLVASRGSVLELPGGRSGPAQVRALGSTFAKVVGLDASALVQARADLASHPTTALDWGGHDDSFVGWTSWFDAGDRATVILANLASVRETWRGAEASGRETRRGWPIDDLISPATMSGLPEAHAAVLGRVAEPCPTLIEATVGCFSRPPTTELSRRSGPAASISPAAPRPGTRLPASKQGQTLRDNEPQSAGELTFDVADPNWRGDLGLFLSRRISPGATRVVVKVVGGGTWPMTPVRLPDGVSIEIDATGPGGNGPTWVPASGSSAPALLEVQGGSLALANVSLAWSPSAHVARLVRVEDGHLVLSRCTLRSGESAMPAGSGLVLFRAAGSRPLPPRAGPFLSATDRPTAYLVDSLLMAVGGEAIAAELGRGVITLVNTAILSEGEGAAIALRPQKVARTRFESDLVIDRCSIAAERSLVELGPWLGSDPGPARPWLVSSRRSAFFEVSPRGKRGSVLLRSLGDGLAHGALAWQADGDGYDLAHFTASGPGEPTVGRQRPDVKALWIDFWSPRHIGNVVGPNPRKGDVASVLTHDRLRPDSLTLQDLRLDPKTHPDLGVDPRLLPGGVTRGVPIPF